MEQAPDQAATLAVLGLAGICRETLRVARSHPPGFPVLCGMVATLSLSLLAHVAAYRPLFSGDPGFGIRRLAAEAAQVTFLAIIGFQYLFSAAFCVFSVAPCYSGFAADLREMPTFLAKYLVSVSRLTRTGPGAIARLAVNFCHASLVVLAYAITCAVLTASAAAYPWWVLRLIRTTFLAGVAHVVMLWRVSCVLSVLEDSAVGLGALRSSHDLLVGAGKFWATAAVLVTLDGCALALHRAFGALVVDNTMGLGVWLRVAVGAVMAAALWTAMLAGLLAQLVVYFVCNNSNATTKSPTGVGKKGQ